MLALLLGDGTQLVTQIVPSPLLRFSLAVLRGAFAPPPLHKPVWTFSFDRRASVTPALLAKTHAAVAERAVVLSTPAAVKAFMLKLLELLHLLDTVRPHLILYKIMSHGKALSWESIIFLLTPPTRKHTLLQYYCTTIAQYTPPSTDPSFKCHTPYNIGDGDIVQRPSRTAGPASRTAPPPLLVFTRDCHYQYCMACIAIHDSRGGTLYCAIVWAMKGEEWGAQTRGVFVNNRIDCFTKA